MPDRKKDREEISRLMITRRRSVLMLAPRRIGKTWTMRRIEEDADQAEYNAVFYDAQKARNPEQFYSQINRAIEAKLGFKRSIFNIAFERVRNIITGDHKDGDVVQVLGGLPQQKLFEGYLREMNSADEPMMLLVDEIAIFALRILRNDKSSLELFLSEMREARLSYPNVRWLLTGSIGLDWVAKEGEAEGTLNDLVPYDFLPFDYKAAAKFCSNILTSNEVKQHCALSEDGLDYLCRELGWLSPYYLEAIMTAIIPSVKQTEGLPIANSDDVEKSFEVLMQRHNQNYFNSWKEHIKKNFPSPMKERLQSILSRCAANVDGEELGTLFGVLSSEDASVKMTDILTATNILINDGYLSETDDRNRVFFRSGLLRRWWVRWGNER